MRKDVGSDATEAIYFAGRLLAERKLNGDWIDSVYANGARVVRALNYENQLHIYGTNTTTSVWSIFPFSHQPTNSDGSPYTVRSHDRIYFKQFQSSSARGGIGIWFTDWTYLQWQVTDQNGNMINDDPVNGRWDYRYCDLSAFAGKSIMTVALVADTNTPVGSWDIYFKDVALISTDGTLFAFFSNESTAAMGAPYGSSGVTGRGYEVLHWPSMWAEGGTYFVHGDHLGSTVMLTNISVWPVWRSTYLPHGYEWNAQATGENLKYTGQERDSESNLDHFWFRQYSSTQGRWMSPDPAGLGAVDLSNPQSLNRYAYVMNNPVNATDPFGLWCDMSNSACTIARYQSTDTLSRGGGGGDYSCSVDGYAADCGMVQSLVSAGLAYPRGCSQDEGGTVWCPGAGGTRPDPKDGPNKLWLWDPTRIAVQSGDQAVFNQGALEKSFRVPNNHKQNNQAPNRTQSVGGLVRLINNPITHLLEDGMLIVGGTALTVGPWVGTAFLCMEVGPACVPLATMALPSLTTGGAAMTYVGFTNAANDIDEIWHMVRH